MTAIVIYRVLIAVRAGWLIIESFFGWGAPVSSFTLRHSFASLVTSGIAVAFLLVVLLGMRFFKRWARLIWVLLIAAAFTKALFGAQRYSLSSPPSFVGAIEIIMLLATVAIVAMSLLPPVRDFFVTKKA